MSESKRVKLWKSWHLKCNSYITIEFSSQCSCRFPRTWPSQAMANNNVNTQGLSGYWWSGLGGKFVDQMAVFEMDRTWESLLSLQSVSGHLSCVPNGLLHTLQLCLELGFHFTDGFFSHILNLKEMVLCHFSLLGYEIIATFNTCHNSKPVVTSKLYTYVAINCVLFGWK